MPSLQKGASHWGGMRQQLYICPFSLWYYWGCAFSLIFRILKTYTCEVKIELNLSILVDETNDENLCTYIDEDDCRYTFVYTYDEKGKILVRAEKERDCPQPVYVLGKDLKTSTHIMPVADTSFQYNFDQR